MSDKPVFSCNEPYTRDESECFYVNGIQVGYANYDELGSSGQEAVRDMFQNIAKVLGVTIEYIEENEE
jgi:hypothetical protein